MSFWKRYARMGPTRAMAICVALVAVVGIAAPSLKRMRVDARLEALLPKDTPAQRALAELRSRASSDAAFTVLITGEDGALNRRLAQEVAEAMRGWEEVRWVTARREVGAFQQGAALYLETDTLQRLAEDLEALLRWEQCARLPGCVNIEDRPLLPTRDALVEHLAESPAGRAWQAYLGHDLSEGWRDQGGQPTGAAETTDEADRDLLCAHDGSVCAVQAALRGSASDLAYARRMVDAAETLFRRVRPVDAPDSLRMVVTGRYRNAPMERAAIDRDLRRIALLSTALVVLVLLVQFRGLRAILLLMAPLALAVLVTLEILAWIHPTLNLVTAFVLAILAGVGVDFGIHLLTHYGEARASGADPAAALGNTLQSLFPSLLAAGATTSLAFAALSASDFRGIAELGWMAGLGVGLSLLTFLFFFPAFTVVIERLAPERRGLGAIDWLTPLPPPSHRAAVRVTALGASLGVIGLVLLPQVALETDFRRLRPDTVSHGIPTQDALGGPAGISVYLLADDPAELDQAAADLVEREFDGVAPLGGSLMLAPGVLVPPDADARLQAVRSIRASAEGLARRAEGDDADELDELLRWVAVDESIGPEQLPVSVRESLTERGGSFGLLGVLYLRLRGYDAVKMEALSQQLEAWHDRYPEVRFASPSAMLGEVLPALRADSLTIVGLALLGLGIASALFGRSPQRALLVLAPVALAMVVSVACMVALDLRINLYNVLVLPVAFGVGVDGAVYVVWATADASSRETFWARFRVAARAVIGSSMTSLVAFGSISIAGNPGLSSLGQLAILTLTLTLVANVVWLPCLLLGRFRRPAE